MAGQYVGVVNAGRNNRTCRRFTAMMFKPGDDVWVHFEDSEWPGEVLKAEGGYVMCRVHVDPEWDFGRSSARIMPEQTVAVKAGRVRERVWQDPPEILGTPQG